SRNEEILLRHHEVNLIVISALGITELIEGLYRAFSASQAIVSLVLLDPGYEIRRTLNDSQLALSKFPSLMFAQNLAELGNLQSLKLPVIGAFNEQQYGYFFPPQRQIPASAALVPLLLPRGELIGILALGSLDERRFRTGMATDFLQHVSSIIAVCLENVINIERLKLLGITDQLTGINNRRHVEACLAKEVEHAGQCGGSLSCLYIDIDHFKHINDGYGHQCGDDVLREVASRVKAEVGVGATFGRFGGEEFIILLPDTQMADAIGLAERIRERIGNYPFVLAGENRQITVSLGVSTMNLSDIEQADETIGARLLSSADKALYKAKEGGRNQVQVS
ncbi:MAG: DUF484 family protein, partial [Burkholderiaceae bacterium]